MSKMQDSDDEDDNPKERKKTAAAAPTVVDLVDDDDDDGDGGGDDDLEKLEKTVNAMLKRGPAAVVVPKPQQQVAAPKPTTLSMNKPESKSKQQQQPQSAQNPPPPLSSSSSSSNSGKRKRDEEEEEQMRKKAKTTTMERMEMRAADAHIDPVKSFGLKMQAIMYKATELDRRRNLLGPYIIRWMFFTAMEQLATDGGHHWFEFLHGCIYSFLGNKLLSNAKKWQPANFEGQEVANFMITFATTIVNIALDEETAVSAAAAAKPKNPDEAKAAPVPILSEEWENSSALSRNLAMRMRQKVEELVKLEGKNNTPVFSTNKKAWYALRDLIGWRLYKYTHTAVNQERPPPNHAWFIWDFLEECTDSQIREDVKNKETEIHDGSMINNLLQACFIPDHDTEDEEKSACGMLRGLYVVEKYLHRVNLSGSGNKRLHSEEHLAPSRIKGLTALAVLLSIANAETMLPTRNKSENAGLYKNTLDKNGVFDGLLKDHQSLQADVIQYIATCRAQLKKGRYAIKKPGDVDGIWRNPLPVEKKTKLTDWALIKLSAVSSSKDEKKTAENKGQGAATLIATVKDFVYRDLTTGLMKELKRNTKHDENVTLRVAWNLMDRFLSHRIGTGVVRPILLAESAATNKAKQKGLTQSAFTKAFGEGVAPNTSIADGTGDFRWWADIGTLQITDTSVRLLYSGLVWSLALRGDNLDKFDTADSFVIDDDPANPLIDKPREDKSKQKSLLTKAHVLTSAARSGRGQFLTWWFVKDKWICTFGVRKTYKDEEDPKEDYPLTLLVPTSTDLLLKLHLVDVLEGQKLTEGQIHNDSIPLDIKQISMLQQMRVLMKKKFSDSRNDNRLTVDYRVADALVTTATAITGYKESEKRLGIFSSLPSVVLLQGGVLPVEDWRTQYLSGGGDAKSSMTGTDTKDALLRATNDNLLEQLTRANGRVKASGKIDQIEVKDDNKMADDDKAPELSDIPVELRPAYAGLFDLLVAYRVQGYLADAIKAFYTAAGDSALKREILKIHLDDRKVKALNTADQIQLAIRGREAQVASLNSRLGDVKTNGHPSFVVRISGEIRAIEAVMVQLRERSAFLDAKAKKAKEELEMVDEFEAAEAVQDAEVHMNAFLQLQSNLLPVVQKLGNMPQKKDFQPTLKMIQDMYKEVAKSISDVYKVLLVPDENPLSDFRIEDQLKLCKLHVDAAAASKQSAFVQYWINEAKRLNVKGEHFKDVAALLLLIDRFRKFLIALGNSYVDKAEAKLQTSEYIEHAGEEEGRGGKEAEDEQDDEEGEGDNADRQFVEDKALQTEADRINALDDRSLISVCVSTAEGCSLPLEDLAPGIQQHTKELLQTEAATSSHLDASVNIDAYNTEDIDMESMDLQQQQQRLTLTREGKQQIRQTRRVNADAIKHAQLILADSESKTMMDESGDGKEEKKKKKKETKEIVIKDDADRTTLQRRVTRLRVVFQLLHNIIDPVTSGLNLPTSDLEPYTKDLAVIKDPIDQIRYLLNEEKDKFNQRANRLFELEFIARDAIDKEERKQRLEFVDGANKAMTDIKQKIGRFSKRDVGSARKQQQQLSQVGRDRLISMQFRGGRAHPQLPLQPLMEEVCDIVHQDRRPKIWTLLDTAAELLKYATTEALDRWTIRQESSTEKKKGKKKKDRESVFKDDEEKYQIINRIILSGCLPYRVLRAQLLFGLVPSIAGIIGDGGDNVVDEILDPNNPNDAYHLHLIDLERRLLSAREITNPDNYKKGTIGIDTAIRIFLSKHSDGVAKKKKKQKEKKRVAEAVMMDDDVDDDDDFGLDLADDPKQEQTERFLAKLCSKLYDRSIDAEAEKKKQTGPSDMITSEDGTGSSSSNDLSPIEAGYDWKRGESVLNKVLATFATEFEHKALDEKAIEEEVKKNTLKMDDGDVLLISPELIRNRMKRDHVMNALFNKAFEWRLPAPPAEQQSSDAKASSVPPPENLMLAELVTEQIDYMYNNIRQHLLQPMLDDIKKSPLTNHGVLPEIQSLLVVALTQASRAETITGPIKASLTSANSRMEMSLNNFWKATRAASANDKLPPDSNKKLFAMNSEPKIVLDAFQKDDNFKMKHLMKLMKDRHRFYRLAQASIRYLQLLPLLIQVIRITIPDRNSTAFDWKAPPVNLGLTPVFLLDASDGSLRETIYREFQAVSEILTSDQIYLPAHLDFQGVLEAYWGLETFDVSPYRKYGGTEPGQDHLALFNMLYPCPRENNLNNDLEILQTVRRMLGWQNPRDGLEYYVYRRQIPAGKNFDISTYRDPIAPVHWEDGTIRLEELNVLTNSDNNNDDSDDDSKEEKYAYWNEEAIALRHAAKLARVHFGLASDADVKETSRVDVFRTVAEALRMLKDEKIPVQNILTRLAIPLSLDNKKELAPVIREANNTGRGARRQHLYRGVFTLMAGAKKEIVTAGGSGDTSNTAGVVKKDEELSRYLQDTDSAKLGLRAEDDKFYTDEEENEPVDDDPMQDDDDDDDEGKKSKKKNKKSKKQKDEDEKVREEIIGSLTLPAAATAIYFKHEKKTTGIAQLGKFAHWATVRAWKNKDNQFRDQVIEALGGKVPATKPKKKKKAKKTNKDLEALALPLEAVAGEGKETKAEPPVVVSAPAALPRPGEQKRKLITNAEANALKRQQEAGIRSALTVQNSSSRESMAPFEVARMAIDALAKNPMDTSGRFDNDNNKTPPPQRRRRKLFYADSNPVVVSAESTHPASLSVAVAPPPSRARRKLFFAAVERRELERVPVSVSS